MKSTSRRTWASGGGKMPRPKSSVKSSSHQGRARGFAVGGSNFGAVSACATARSEGADGAARPRFGGGGGLRDVVVVSSGGGGDVSASIENERGSPSAV